MTDEERFEVVFGELSDLLLALSAVGLGNDAVVIGAQVVALQQKALGQELFHFQTANGVSLQRQFSFEPDLVLDSDNEWALEQLPGVLRQCGFKRSTKSYRWSKQADEVTIDVDLFSTADASIHPTPMTRVVGAPRFKSTRLDFEKIAIQVPDPCTFLSLKLKAKRELRPEHTKDSFDLYAYLLTVGAEVINASLNAAGTEGIRVRAELRQLFGATDSAGVSDVVAAGLGSGDATEKGLLARAVVDEWERVLKSDR